MEYVYLRVFPLLLKRKWHRYSEHRGLWRYLYLPEKIANEEFIYSIRYKSNLYLSEKIELPGKMQDNVV